MFSKKFICASYDYSSYKDFVPSPYFRKSFVIYSKPQSCTVTICGLGFYEVFINGHKITKGILAPYISNPDDIIYYDSYDITEYIQDGRNVLGIQLGNGMQNAPGGEIWDFQKAAFRGAPRVAFTIEIENSDDTVDIIEANRSVKTAPSPIAFDDLRAGCFYDARNEIESWAEIKYVDDMWEDALIAETPRGEARLCEAEPIMPIRHISPFSITKCTAADYKANNAVTEYVNPLPTKVRDGYLYDFGINSAGIERLKIRGERGQQIDLQFCEFINNDGNPDYGNINFYPDGFAQRDIYICKGQGEEIFEPKFTYHGFRYCIVYGITEEQATNELLSFIICSSALKERGNFRCSDDIANKLQAMTRNSTLSNFYYFPTDCPHREKNGWTGDAAVSSEHVLLNLSAEKSYKEWLRSIRKAQREDGSIPGIVPTGGWGYEWGNGPMWDAVLIYIPYFTYRYRGDKEILTENAPSIFRYAEYLSTHRTRRGTVELGLGDWCPVTVVKSPLEFTDSVISMSILRKAAFIFSVLDMPHKKEYCEVLYSEIRAAVRKNLVDLNTMTAIGNCQTSQALAIYYDVFEPGEKATAFSVLKKIIEKSDEHIDFGLIGSRVIFRVLSDFGESDLAYKMIVRTDYPSYGNFVKRGLTALPEDFRRDSDRPNSLNHHFMGDISAWFIKYIAGIQVNPDGNDISEIIVSPHFIKDLTSVEGFHEAAQGKITVSWKRVPRGIELKIERASALHGEVRLPDGWTFEKTKLSYRKLSNGTFFVLDDNAIPDNIIEV